MSNELNYTAAQVYQDMKALGVDLPMAGYTIQDSTDSGEGQQFIAVSYEYFVPYEEITHWVQWAKDWNRNPDEPSPFISFDLVGGGMKSDKSKGWLVGAFNYLKGDDAEVLAGIARWLMIARDTINMNDVVSALATAFTYGQ